MNAHATGAETFHAGTVDQPTGSQFHLAGLRHRISRHIGIIGPQFLRHSSVDDRIFKETTGVARNSRIRQLRLPDGTNSVADVAQRSTPARLDLALDVAVTQMRLRRTGQTNLDSSDDDTSLEVVLEDAFAISECAMSTVERQCRAALDAIHLDTLDDVARLAPISTDILHGSSACLARNGRKILDTPQTALDGPCDQIIPLDAGIDAHGDRNTVVVQHGNTLRHGGQQQAVIVLGKEDIVPAAEHHPPFGDTCSENSLQIGDGLEFDQPSGPLPDMETIARLQIGSLKFSYHIVQS